MTFASTTYTHVPSYKLTYYVERLSCGHEQFYYPQAGPMSRRRHCAECATRYTTQECGETISVGRKESRIDTDHKKPVSSSQDEQEKAA